MTIALNYLNRYSFYNFFQYYLYNLSFDYCNLGNSFNWDNFNLYIHFEFVNQAKIPFMSSVDLSNFLNFVKHKNCFDKGNED